MEEDLKLVVKGKIVSLGHTVAITEKFSKRELLLEVEDKNPAYNQKIPFDFTQDRCKYLDKCAVGDLVTLKFNIRTSLWKERYIVSLQGWFISKDENSPVQPNSNDNIFDDII